VAYDEGLAQRLRASLANVPRLTEKKMFGGLAFLVAGNLCVGVIGEELVARVGPAAFPDAVGRTGARPFDFSGRPMAGWVMVRPEGVQDDDLLGGWVGRSLEFVRTLPPR
jgi:TfoX N-terminal domain